jgi:hypothetical protein
MGKLRGFPTGVSTIAQNDFLPFAIAANANVRDQPTWAASSVLSTGMVSGEAISLDFNKAWRQPSFVGAAISQWINQELVNTPILDDGNLQEYINNFDAALLKRILSQVRIKATGAVTVYVSALSGNDANNGLSTSAPFRNIQTGINYMLNNVDLGPNQATVMIEAGTYNESILVGSSPLGLLGIGQFQLGTYNGQVAINGTGYVFALSGGAQLSLAGNFLLSCLQTANQPNAALVVSAGSRLACNGTGLVFGNSPSCSHIYATTSGQFGNAPNGSYTIAGGGLFHWHADTGGSVSLQSWGAPSLSITLQNTPNFSDFAAIVAGGTLSLNAIAFVGTGATGTRYTVRTNGVITTNGAGASYLPGNVAGNPMPDPTGGQYV